jgi:ribosomal protein S18 acetylase RimI-like enzyme
VNTIIRPIDSNDVVAVASVHAASWRSAYRGILRDEFLDGDLVADRVALWAKRLSPLPQENFGYLAFEAEQPIGFAFAFGVHDPHWGTLVDNLHVLPRLKGRGLGKRLLVNLCERANAAHPNAGLYLWVYERNTAARGFYETLGGEPVERAVIQAPGGGEVAEWRYAWPSAKRGLEALER